MQQFELTRTKYTNVRNKIPPVIEIVKAKVLKAWT